MSALDENKNKDASVAADDAAGDSSSQTGVGVLLRLTRERTGAELAAVAEILRIRYVYMQAIEDGRFDDLPGPAYAMGFVRTYADYLGLDSEEIVRRFKQEGNAAGRADSDFLVPTHESNLPSFKVILLGLIIVALGFGGYLWSTSDNQSFIEVVRGIPERFQGVVDDVRDQQDDPDQLTPQATPSAPDDSTGAPAEVPDGSENSPESAAEPGNADASESQIEENATPSNEPTSQDVQEENQAPSGQPSSGSAPTEQTGGNDTTENTDAAPTSTSSATPPPVEVVSTTEAPTDTSAEDTLSANTSDGSPAQPASGQVDATPPPTVISAADMPTNGGATATTSSETTETETVQSVSASDLPQESPDAPERDAPERDAPERDAPESGASDNASPTEAVTETATGASTETTSEASSLSSPEAPAESTSDNQSAAQVADLPTVPDAPPAPGSPVIHGTADGRVQILAQRDTWMQINDGDALITSRLLRAGDTYGVPNKPGLVLRTGNAGGMAVFVDGERVPPLGGDGEVRSGVSLNPDDLLAR